MRVLVVGSGPTGLTAALALRQAGCEVRIAEQREDASNLSRAVGILPATMTTFGRLGVAGAVRAEALIPTTLRISRAGRKLGTLDISDIRDADREILLLAQDRTEAILRDALSRAGVEVEFGNGVTRLSQKADTVTAGFDDGSTDRFEHVIGADGVRSTVREQVGIAYDGEDISPRWSIADVDVAGDFDPGRVFIDLGTRDTGITVALPFADRRIRIVAARPEPLEDLPLPITPGRIHRTSEFMIPVRQAARYVEGRVLLAGDAAHSHSPVGGRGMNLGIADAAAATTAILNGTLAAYDRTRRAEGRRVIDMTERARRLVTTGSPLVAAGFRVALAVLGRSRTARRRAFARLTAL